MASINYDDERLTEVEEQRKEALSENEKLYGDMAEKSDSFYQGLVDESKQWADKQSQIQQEQTDFVVEQIEQQKEQAQKDYTKEQKGAYRDWKKQENAYGAQAEQMASSGLANTGFSETAKVGMYNTYQNRVATARESLDKLVLGYNNQITEAKLQNSSALAELAHTSLQQQLSFLLEGFQYKNQLLQEEANKKLTINSMYDSKYQAVVDQINTENALAEQQRQFDAEMKFNREQFEYQKAQDKKNYELQQEQLVKQNIQNASNSATGLLSKISAALGGLSGGSSDTADDYGNSKTTQKKKDYWLFGTKQPAYIDNEKVKATGLNTTALWASNDIPKPALIYSANGKYYAWCGNADGGDYLDVTDRVNSAIKIMAGQYGSAKAMAQLKAYGQQELKKY